MRRIARWLLGLLDHQVTEIRIDPDGDNYDKVTLRRCDGKVATIQVPMVYGVEWRVNAHWRREAKSE